MLHTFFMLLPFMEQDGTKYQDTIIINMKKEITNKVYVRPEIEVINFKMEAVICDSPGNGENEGTEDEELNP